MSDCLGESDLEHFEAGDLPPIEQARIAAHLQHCTPCAALHAMLTSRHEQVIQDLRKLKRDGRLETATPEPGIERIPAGPHGADTAAPVDRSLPIVPRYRLLHELHRGGQGVVYAAMQESTGRQVAIKILHHRQFTHAQEQLRFEREVRILAGIRHPNIVNVLDSGRADGMPFIAMDLVDGHRLDEYLATGQRTPRAILALFQQICVAVNAAHLVGVLHRDLKPANIMVDAAGAPHILDFGLAKPTLPGMDLGSLADAVTIAGNFLGTLPWACPEQFIGRGANLDVRADVYALGVMLYQALTGAFPYPISENMRATIDSICNHEPARPSQLRTELGSEIDAIVLRSLAKEPGRRYQSAGELARDLGRYLAGEPIEAKRDSTLYVLRKTMRRYRLAAAFSGVIALLGIGFGVAISIEAAKVKRNLNRATAAEQQAEGERRNAETQRNLAQAETERFRRRDYALHIALADTSIRTLRTDQLVEHLNECPADLRGWEWARLKYLSDSSTVRLVDEYGGNMLSSPDGRFIYASVGSGYVDIIDTSLWSRVKRLKLHQSAMLGLSLSRDGRFLASFDASNIRVTELPSGRSVQEIHEDLWIAGCLLSPDAQTLYWQLNQPPFCTRVQAVGADEYREFSSEQVPPGLGVLSGDGRVLARGDWHGQVFLYELPTFRLLKQFQAHQAVITALRFLADDHRLLTASGDGTASLWSLDPPQLIRSFSAHDHLVCVDCTPDGQLIAVGGRDQLVHVWSLDAKGPLLVGRGTGGSVSSVCLLPDQKRLVSCGGDRAIRTWDVPGRPEEFVWSGPDISPPDGGFVANYSPGGGEIATGTRWGVVQIWDARAVARPLRTFQAAQAAIQQVEYSRPGDRLLVCSDEPSIGIWDAHTGQLVRTLAGHTQGVPVAIFSPDGRLVLSGSWDGTCRLWDLATGATRFVLRHQDEVWDAAFSPDGQRAASGSRNGRVRIWDTQTGAELATLQAHSAAVDALAFSSDGRRLVSGGHDGYLHMWDLATTQRVFNLKSQSAPHYEVLFSPDGRRIISTGTEWVEVWDAETGALLYAFKAHGGSIFSARLSPDGRNLLTAGDDGSFKVWPSTPVD